MRMILDARNSNRYFRRPPVPPMVTGEGFSKIELDPPRRSKGGSLLRVTSATLSVVCLLRRVWVGTSHFQLSAQKTAGLVGRRVEGRTLLLTWRHLLPSKRTQCFA